jgi:hypothetical protein
LFIHLVDCIGSDSDPLGDSAAIFSGHPHISIVTVYRNTCWMRIPSLGLVKGDIIALMAGDITPGKVHELLPEENLRKNTLLQDPTYSVENIEKEIRKNIDENDRNDKNETNNDKKSFEIDAYEEENIYQINNNSTKNNKINDGEEDKEPSWSRREDSTSSRRNSTSNVKNPILSYASKSNSIFRIEKVLEKGTKIHLRSRFPDKMINRSHTQPSKTMNENENNDSAVFGDAKNKNRKAMKRTAAVSDNYQGKQGSGTSRVSNNVHTYMCTYICTLVS